MNGTPRNPKNDSFGEYLSKIGKLRVLTRKEEAELGDKVQKAIQVTQLLAEGVEPESTEEYERILDEGQKARQTMIEHNIRLVVFIAKRYQHRGISTEDLVQEGTVGLHKAVEKFNPELGYKFSTYAYWWIRQAITKALACDSRTVKMPSDIYGLIDKVKRKISEIHKKEGRIPSLKEVSTLLNKDYNRIHQAVMCCKQFVSLDSPKGAAGEKNTLSYHSEAIMSKDSIVKEDEEVEVECRLETGKKRLSIPLEFLSEDIIHSLTKQQQYILIRKFGLHGAEPVTYKTIAEELNLSISLICKYKDQAFDKIRQLCLNKSKGTL